MDQRAQGHRRIDAAAGDHHVGPRLERARDREAAEIGVHAGDPGRQLRTGVHLAEAQSTVDRVVIGDADRGELGLPGECGEVGERDAAIAGVLGVHVHVEPDLLHPIRSGRRRARRGYGTRGSESSACPR